MAGDRARALRSEAASVLVPLADLAAPVAPGHSAPWDQLIRIRDHEVDRAAGCGASLAHDRDFDGWRSAFARRRLARLVLERMRRVTTEDTTDPPDPTVIARGVVDDEASAGRDGLGRWLADLGPGGRAAVVRDVTTYAAAARAAIPQWPPAATRFAPPPFTWELPGRAVRLEATVDAEAWSDGDAGPARSLLVLAPSSPGEEVVRRQVAWAALVATLATAAVPIRVTRLDLASGARRAVPVTDDVLDRGLTDAAAAVDAAVSVRHAAPPEPVPGPWCAGCDGRDVCDVASPPVPFATKPREILKSGG